MRSPTFISPGFVQSRGTARNPIKKNRSWIPKYHDPYPSGKLAEVARSTPLDVTNRSSLQSLLKRAYIPGTNDMHVSTYDVHDAFGVRARHTRIVTRATGKNDFSMLQALRRKLIGTLQLDTLERNATYRIYIACPSFFDTPRFKETIHTLTANANVFAYLRKHIPQHTSPIYFAGLHPKLRAYVIVMADPGETYSVPRSDRGQIPIYNRVLEIGVYPNSASTVRLTHPPDHPDGAKYLIIDPSKLYEIPKMIHTAYKKYIRTEPHPSAWISAGGASWAADTEGIEFEFPHLHRFETPEPITLNETMKHHLHNNIHLLEVGRASVRVLDEQVVTSLNSIQANSKKIGSGSYGTVFDVPLRGRYASNMHNMMTVLSALTNVNYFNHIDTQPRVVLKIEKLQRLTPIDSKLVYQLAGESYIQQYVHINRGVPNTNVTRTVVAPKVYFSGTLANKYHLICMAHVDGIPLSKYAKKGYITEDVYDAMSVAVKTLIRNGVVHSDLHMNNVFITKDARSTRATILDYGFATIVPPAIHRKMVKALESGSIDDAYHKTGVINVINAAKSRFTYYHSNAKMMRLLTYLKQRRPLTPPRSHVLREVYGITPRSNRPASRPRTVPAARQTSTPTSRRRVRTTRPSRPSRSSRSSSRDPTLTPTRPVDNRYRTARSG